VRVVCAYHPDHLRRETVDALPPETEYVDVSEDVEAYWRLFALLWAERRDFLLVEHDVVIAPVTIKALEACPEPWCSCYSPALAADYGPEAWFQCNRWRAEVMHALPNVPDIEPRLRHWKALDTHLLRRIREGFTVHAHPELPTFHLAPGLGTTQPTK
jgi:hypothetical protein